MTATSGGNVHSSRVTSRIMVATLIATLALGFLSIGTASAQSAGCAGGPYDGATALDSDGDGVNDADEVRAGTDGCDPASTPTAICGTFVANYDAATADTDDDGHTDAAEVAAGSDACDATSVIAAAAVTPAAATPAATTPAAAPVLALTGPSNAMISALIGFATLLLGIGATAVSRRIEA